MKSFVCLKAKNGLIVKRLFCLEAKNGLILKRLFCSIGKKLPHFNEDTTAIATTVFDERNYLR